MDWISPAEAAKYLCVNKTTVIRWINEGQLPAWRVGTQFRIERSAVEAFAQPVNGPR